MPNVYALTLHSSGACLEDCQTCQTSLCACVSLQCVFSSENTSEHVGFSVIFDSD